MSFDVEPDAPLHGECAAEIATLTKERDALRSTRQKGCDCTDDEACRFARERDEARAQAAKLESALVSRHGGEPVALLAELDEARAEVERLRIIVSECAKATGSARVEPDASLDFMRYIPNEIGAALKSVAERQRTACAAFVRDNYYECAQSEAVGTDPMWCVAQTPLVTEGE